MLKPHRIGHAACLAPAMLALVLGGCAAWNARERDSVREALERMKAAAQDTEQTEADRPVIPALPPVKQGQVELALFDAIRVALANNQDLQIAGYQPLLAEADLVRAHAVYDTNVFLKNEFGRSRRPIGSLLEGIPGQGHLIDDTWEARAGFSQRLSTGGLFSLYQQMNYVDTNNRSTVPGKQYTTRVTGEVSQPLLKGFGDTLNQAAIRIANLTTGVTLEDFRLKVMEVVAKVTAAYWQLAFDADTVRIHRETLEMAREVLRREQARGKQGLSNELNIARASSAAATREVELVRAENRVRNSADELKRLINSPDMPVESEIEILAIEPPRFFLVDIDRSACMARALARRPELQRARTTLAMNRIRIEAADRERLPKLDALLRYTLNGLDTDLGDSFDSLHFPDPATWVAGLEFEVPLGNRIAEADHQKRQIEYEQTLLEADRLTDSVLKEVGQAVRAILQSRDEVESTLRAEEQARKVVKGERVRFELGQVGNEELLRAQDNLAAAERDHLLALLSFNLALTEVARAQGTLIEDRDIEIVWPEADRPRRFRPIRAGLPEKSKEAKPADAPAEKTDEAPPQDKPAKDPAAPGPQAKVAHQYIGPAAP